MSKIVGGEVAFTTQLISCHVLVCITICYKPEGNIIIILSPLELKSGFISNETP